MADQNLREFVTTNTLPARVKVTEGVYLSGWEFSNGDVLDLHKIVCPSVQLAFVHPDTGEERTLSVSTQSPCLFKIMPYIPDQPVQLNKAMVIHGTTELIRIWPSVVCARASYSDARRGLVINKGEKLRPKRVLHKDGVFLLECSRSNSQLVLLPVGGDLEYLLVEDMMAYTLAEIADMPGRVERRLRVSDDTINKTQPIPGFPRDFIGDVIMAPPQRFVEIHPADSPGEQIVAPIDVDISVSDRDTDYIGLGFRWYPLENFVSANSSKFPMVVAIADWAEEPVTVQAIRASINDRIVLYKMEQILKVLCQVANSYFVIPLTYDAAFEVKPRRFSSISDVCTQKAKKVRVLRDCFSREPGLSGVNKGEILEVISIGRDGVTVKRKDSGIAKLPLTLLGQYEEIIDLSNGNKSTLKEIKPSMLPLTVVFHELSASIPPRRDPLPRGEEIVIKSMFSESCVRASKNIERGLSSPIPLRTGISVRYISQYKKTQAPDISSFASCPEEITEEKLPLLPPDISYENLASIPEDVDPPPLKPRKASFDSNKGALDRSTSVSCRPSSLPTSPESESLPDLPGRTTRPSPDRKGAVQSTPAPGPVLVKRSISAPSPPVPPRPGKPNGAGTRTGRKPTPVEPELFYCTIDDEVEYEEVLDLDANNYACVMADIFGKEEPPSITTPADANLSSFSWKEMVVFLQLFGMPAHSLKLFARDRITGADFAALDNSQLASYGINNPIIRHYKNKSKKRTPVAQFL